MTEDYLEIGPTDDIEFGVTGSEVVITINGRNLIEMVKEIELSYAQWEGSPDIAGSEPEAVEHRRR